MSFGGKEDKKMPTGLLLLSSGRRPVGIFLFLTLDVVMGLWQFSKKTLRIVIKEVSRFDILGYCCGRRQGYYD